MSKKKRPTAIKITGGKNITIKGNVGVGDMDLLDAENVENMDADKNVLITPHTSSKPKIKNPWYKEYIRGILIAAIAGLIVAAIVLFYLQPWAESQKKTIQNDEQTSPARTDKQRPTAIKITGGKNITIKGNVGVGDMDLLDAENVENLDVDKNVLISPEDAKKK
jgi:hypothetical protein